MDVSFLVRLRLQQPPEAVAGVEPPDPREVDRICSELKWPEAYCERWVAFAAGLPDRDADGKPMTWSRKHVRGLLFIRDQYEKGRLGS